jgi:hypothetical protein
MSQGLVAVDNGSSSTGRRLVALSSDTWPTVVCIGLGAGAGRWVKA